MTLEQIYKIFSNLGVDSEIHLKNVLLSTEKQKVITFPKILVKRINRRV